MGEGKKKKKKSLDIIYGWKPKKKKKSIRFVTRARQNLDRVCWGAWGNVSMHLIYLFVCWEKEGKRGQLVCLPVLGMTLRTPTVELAMKCYKHTPKVELAIATSYPVEVLTDAKLIRENTLEHFPLRNSTGNLPHPNYLKVSPICVNAFFRIK